jgi:hypothetical protein
VPGYAACAAPDAAALDLGAGPTRHNQVSSPRGNHAGKEETTCWRSSSSIPRRHSG